MRAVAVAVLGAVLCVVAGAGVCVRPVDAAQLVYPDTDLQLNTLITEPFFTYIFSLAPTPAVAPDTAIYLLRSSSPSDTTRNGQAKSASRSTAPGNTAAPLLPESARDHLRHRRDGAIPVHVQRPSERAGAERLRRIVTPLQTPSAGVSASTDYGQQLLLRNGTGTYDLLSAYIAQQQTEAGGVPGLALSTTCAFMPLSASGGTRVLATAQSTLNGGDDDFEKQVSVFVADIVPPTADRIDIGPRQLWLDAPTPVEPLYWPNGTAAGSYSPNANTSVVISDRHSADCFLPFWSAAPALTAGTHYYVLVETEVFGSTKLLKYVTSTRALVWKTVLVPKTLNRFGVVACEPMQFYEDSASGDVVVTVGLNEDTVVPFLRHWNVTTTPQALSATSAMLLLDPATGAVLNIQLLPADPATAARFSYLSLQAVTIDNGVVYALSSGRLTAPDTVISIVTVLSFTRTARTVLYEFDLTLLPPEVDAVCQPASAFVLVRGALLLAASGTLVVSGDAGFVQVNTGSVVAGGMGFAALLNTTQLLATGTAMTRVLQFGFDSNRDNGGDRLAPLSGTGQNDDGFTMSASLNRGLTHDPPELQYAWSGVFQTRPAGAFPSRACDDPSQWWLACGADAALHDGGCTHWCYQLLGAAGRAPANHTFTTACAAVPGGDGGGNGEREWPIIVGATVGGVCGVILLIAASRCYCRNCRCCTGSRGACCDRASSSASYDDVDIDRGSTRHTTSAPTDTDASYQAQA